MPNGNEGAPVAYIWRGGEKLAVNKVPDRFTVRLRRGVGPEEIEGSYRADYRGSLRRQDLEVFAVDATERDATMNSVRQGNEVEFASHVYAIEGDPISRLYLTDEITAQFKPEVSDDEIESITTGLGLAFVKQVPGAPRAYVFRVTPQSVENPIKIANRLAETDEVLLSEPNITVTEQSFYTPSDSMFSEQWHLHHTGGPFLSADSHIDAVRAWDLTRGERSVVVAVADDSCDVNHSDFQAQGKIISPRDLAGLDFEPLPENEDDNHGTACCGVAVAEENGAGAVGVAPGCALMPIRTSGFLDDSSIEDLFGWAADHGASVVSCSWGPAAINFPLSLRQRNALHRAATLGRNGKGCVIIFASGNANRPVDGTVNERGWPNNLLNGPTRWLDGFAAHEDVIAVAACTSQARKSAYSNWGRQISVCAPSNNAHPGTSLPNVGPTRTYPRITTPIVGRGIVTTDRVGPSGYSSTDYTFDFGGTSSACPTVAGVAALVLSANPDLTAREVREIMESTADKITDPGQDPQLEQSLGSYDQNGHSQWFGYGKVNAFRAVTEAIRRKGAEASRTFRQSSTPALNIPDNNPEGVRDQIRFNEAAIVSSVKVSVDLTHTYKGDLRLTLIAPSGASVTLHDRAGGSANNIQGVFDSISTPGLSRLAGQSMQGAWTLLVQDLAAIDVGQLNRWELEIEGRANAVVELQENPGATIPDNNPAGIERTLTTDAPGRIKEVEVSVDITHTYIGDLIVTLVSPAGASVALHQREGGSNDNIIRTYTMATTPGLQSLRGQNIGGVWRLKVSDLEAIDNGKLNRWGLRFVREA
jgi:subtilisin-like proprotein convertase family protein/subtilisin family serine protease